MAAIEERLLSVTLGAMKLHTESLSLELKARRVVDDEDGVRVGVDAKVGVFSGEFEAFLQLQDLRLFTEQIELLYSETGAPREAVLSCIEPGIYLDLKSDRLGSIAGTCRLEDEASGAELSGVFTIDQSYLPGLASSVAALMEALRPSTSAEHG